MQSQNLLRVATLNSGLKRAGPGLLLRDILKGDDPQISMIADLIAENDPDILLLTRFDFDLGLAALNAFSAELSSRGIEFPYIFALAPNSGVQSGRDLDHDGKLGDARDAIGYGAFAGQGGMALLSRFPIDTASVRDFSAVLWQDLPDAQLPEWPSGDRTVDRELPLSSVGHWDVPVNIGNGRALHLLAYHATTPAFDGAEDRNGLRNRDETRFWLHYLNGDIFAPPPNDYVLLGDANLDPSDGEGRHQTMRDLLASALVIDPKPRSERGEIASREQGGVNRSHKGDPALDTADWRDVSGPGNLRVDYVLPSAGWRVDGAGIDWPIPQAIAEYSDSRGGAVSLHGLVWVDIFR